MVDVPERIWAASEYIRADSDIDPIAAARALIEYLSAEQEDEAAQVVTTLSEALWLAWRDLDAARRESFDAGFDAGFAASGEGYNFEYPFQDHGIKPREDSEWSTKASDARAIWLARFEVQEVSE